MADSTLGATGAAARPARAPNKLKFALALIVVVALVFLLIVRVLVATNAAGAVKASMGAPAPNITMSVWNDPGTTALSLAGLRGSPVVINFWEASCVPCAAEAHDLQRTSVKYAPYGVVFLGVALETSRADGVAFLKKYGITYPSGAAPAVATAVAYALPGTPVTVLVNGRGTIVEQVVGQTDATTLGYYIQKLLLK